MGGEGGNDTTKGARSLERLAASACQWEKLEKNFRVTRRKLLYSSAPSCHINTHTQNILVVDLKTVNGFTAAPCSFRYPETSLITFS